MSSPDRAAALESLRGRLAGTNINPDTFLATDYLNHFTEVIMMLALVADMPEMLDDARAWNPIGYADHFRHSQFAERDLAIEVYDLMPDATRNAFEDAVAQTHLRIATAIADLTEAVVGSNPDGVRRIWQAAEQDLHPLIDRVAVIIHGGAAALDQPDIDGLFDDAGDRTPDTSSQDDIDNLFK